MKVEISDQVEAYIRGLPPEPRHPLRIAVRKLENLTGDVRPLEGALQKYQRLRVGAHRVVFSVQPGDKGPVVQCLFAQHRSIVYTVLERMFSS